MDNVKFKHGGVRKGAGRKKGTGLSAIIKNHVDNFMNELIKDKNIQFQIKKDIKQLSLTSGWIYVIKNIDTNLIKIGVTQTSNPKKRLSQYNCYNINYKLIHIDYLENCYQLEDDVHIFLESKRVKGDWFDLNNLDLINVIRTINKHKYINIYSKIYSKHYSNE